MRCHQLLVRNIFFTATGLLFTSVASSAEGVAGAEEQIIIQQQRQKALEQQLTPPKPDVRLSPPSSGFGSIDYPNETPCFPIHKVVLSGEEKLPRWLPIQHLGVEAEGRCLGAQGINLLMSTLQNRLVDHGYITTRVLAPSQDLKSGVLTLVIVPGYVRQVRLTPDSDRYIQLYSTSRHGRANCWICVILNRGWKTFSACLPLKRIWRSCLVNSPVKAISR